MALQYMPSNPYPRAKENISINTTCILCDRTFKTRDWVAHKNSKKHHEAEVKEKHEVEEVNIIHNSSFANVDSSNLGNTGTVGGGRACHGCGQTGHMKRDCPSASAGQGCFNCGETGHRKSECTQPRKGNGGSGGGAGRACHNCKQEGHMSRDCPEPKVMRCNNCDQEGHVSRDCPQPKDWSRVKCKNCEEYGHGAKRCPKPPQEPAGDGWGNSGEVTITSGGWVNGTTDGTATWDADMPTTTGDSWELPETAQSQW